MTDDLMDALARYAPRPESLAAQCPPELRTEVLARTLVPGSTAPAQVFPLQDGQAVAGRRHHRVVALLAACAVILLVAGLVGGITLLSGRHAGNQAGDAPTTSTDVVGPNQFAYMVRDEYLYSAGSSRPVLTNRERYWVAPDGAVWSLTTGRDQPSCSAAPAPHKGNVLSPTVSFFDGLPTHPGQLNSRLRAAAATTRLQTHLAAAPSIDAMVLDEVLVMLDPSDLLASSALRGAMFRVLEQTPGVTVHPDVTDFGEHGATRLDRVEGHGRSRYVSSLYFDPSTARYLGGRTVAAGAHQIGHESLAVISAQRVVDSMPAGVRDCPSR